MDTRIVHPLLRARDWQDRPELTLLCDWWRGSSLSYTTEENAGVRGRIEPPRSQLSNETTFNSASGVCALVGLGGAGKTAIAERFLRVLPAGLPAPEGTAKDETLPSAGSLFVFSFYDAPNPDGFFAELYAWLNDAPLDESAKMPSFQQTLQLLSKVSQRASSGNSAIRNPQSAILLILDGLEKVQDDGARGGSFGQILDGRLRDLILRAADGWLPGVALLITTRFRLFDLMAQRSALYRQIGIDQLQPPAALALLRARGVCATDAKLLVLAEESCFHALTIDLLGGYVAAFCHGDPSHLPPLAEVKVPNEAAADDPRLAGVKEQEHRFARIALRYREALVASDPVALALMERVCLFRLSVNADTLASIFTGAGKEAISGVALAAANREQVEQKLRKLAEMRLLVSSTLGHSERKGSQVQAALAFSAHPVIRDAFMRSLTDSQATTGHIFAVVQMFVELSKTPGVSARPSTPEVLDLLEEIIYHATLAGNASEAWNVFWDQLGHYEHLGTSLGAFDRCERICRMFAGGLSPRRCLEVLHSVRNKLAPRIEVPVCLQKLSEDKQREMLNEWGLALGELGRLDEAALLFSFTAEEDEKAGLSNDASTCSQNLADTLLSAGRVQAALAASEDARRFAMRKNFSRGLQNAYAKRGFANALCGFTSQALADFETAERFQKEAAPNLPLFGRRATLHAWVLGKSGHLQRAEEVLTTNLRNFGEGLDLARSRLLLADLALEGRRFAAAMQLQEQAHEWAIARDATEVLCWSTLVRARSQMVEGSSQASGVRNHKSEAKKVELLVEARKSLDAGLLIARDCGYGIYHIDLLLERARLHLLHGQPQAALDDLRIALADGQKPPLNSGFPTLLAATDPECGYAWGIAEGRHLRAEALLLQAAQTLGRADSATANSISLSR